MDEQLEFVKQVSERLRSAGFQYMMTGSMAMAIYATPRMTRDVDFVLECASSDIDKLVALFASDCYVDRGAVAEAIEHKGVFNIIHNEWIIKGDFIVRKDDSYRRREFERRREFDIEGVLLTVVAPEDLILSKLVWAKETESELQRRDVKEILSAGVKLDRAYLAVWADRLEVRTLLEDIES